MIKISPSILSADRDRLSDEVKEIEEDADYLHIDIMDAKFVPPKTFSAQEILSIRTDVPLDVHLMVEHPIKEGYIDDYKGAYVITIHEECKDGIDEAILEMKEDPSKIVAPTNSLDAEVETKKLEDDPEEIEEIDEKEIEEMEEMENKSE